MSSPEGCQRRDIMRSKPLQIQTLVLLADSDGALGPQLLNGLPGYVPNVEVHTLKNCSHWIQQDRSAEDPSQELFSSPPCLTF